jgi:hypothetical protein
VPPRGLEGGPLRPLRVPVAIVHQALQIGPPLFHQRGHLRETTGEAREGGLVEAGLSETALLIGLSEQ